MINVNELARRVSELEGGKEELSIAQIKEVIRITLVELAVEEPVEVLKLLKRYE